MFHKTRFSVSCLSVVLTSSLSRVKKISASSNDGKQGWYSVHVPPESGTKMHVANLSSNTNYQFSILSQNRMGTGPFSQIVAARTLGQYSPFRNFGRLLLAFLRQPSSRQWKYVGRVRLMPGMQKKKEKKR